MSIELTTGRVYDLKGTVASWVSEPGVRRALEGKALGKIFVNSVTFGAVERRPFIGDRKEITVRFKVIENPLPIAGVIIILVAATGVMLAASLVIKSVTEVIDTTSTKGSGALIIGGLVLGGIALAKGRI